MYASIKRFFARLFVVGLIVYGIAVTAIAVDLGYRNERNSQEAWHKSDILVMASQALTEEQRLRVVQQAAESMCGDSEAIDALKWDFVYGMPKFRNYDADRVVYRD